MGLPRVVFCTPFVLVYHGLPNRDNTNCVNCCAPFNHQHMAHLNPSKTPHQSNMKECLEGMASETTTQRTYLAGSKK